MQKIQLVKGDITKQQTDAIVNAANSSLLGGGGVDGAIHSAAGSALLDACVVAIRNRQGGCKTGEAVITIGGNLPSKYVIHTVGPVWNGDKAEKERLLANSYFNSLKIAVENDIESISFPNISTGIYHFPKDKAAAIAVATVKDFLKENSSIKQVVFVCFDDENYALYNDLLG